MVELQNSILALNKTMPDMARGPDCEGPVTSLGHNLLADPTGCAITLQASDLTGNPGLGEFTDNSTPGRGHFPPQASSRAIDAGDEALCPPTDQLGQPRVGRCDIGAIEFPQPIVLVNGFVTFDPLRSTSRFSPDPTDCPEGFVGTFSFDARLTNTSAHILADLFVEVTTLTHGNLLQNAEGPPFGMGARLTVLQEEGFSDGTLSPHEFVDVSFIICLTQRRSFQFVVDVLGGVDTSADVEAEVQLVP
jgi:hypothetical protein